jgi:uncharacterized protein (TIGR02145 family)
MKTSMQISVICLLIIFNSCKKENPITPLLSSTNVTDISFASATSGGMILSDGGASIIARGVCWSNTTMVPLITDNRTLDGKGTGTFASSITGLTPGTTYYLRAYATNRVGTSYGEGISFTTMVVDIDGNIYTTIKIGKQIWLKENLKVARYNNRELIGTTNPASADYSSESTPKYQWAYDGNESFVTNYGRLYTWYVINDIRKICPINWHVPSNDEWTVLTDFLENNGYDNGSGIGKSMASKTGWLPTTSPGNPGYDMATNNSSGFTAYPNGERYPSGFQMMSADAIWWAYDYNTDFPSSSIAYMRAVTYSPNGVGPGICEKKWGLAVRCIKDN